MHTGRVLPRAGEGQSGKAHGIGMAWGGEILIIPRQGAAACKHRPCLGGQSRLRQHKEERRQQPGRDCVRLAGTTGGEPGRGGSVGRGTAFRSSWECLWDPAWL